MDWHESRGYFCDRVFPEAVTCMTAFDDEMAIAKNFEELSL